MTNKIDPRAVKLIDDYIRWGEQLTVAFIKGMIAHGGFLGNKTKFHEAVEIMYYFKHGYNTLDVYIGKAYAEAHDKAHLYAFHEEFKEVQTTAFKEINKKIPVLAFLVTDPTFELQKNFWNSNGRSFPNMISVLMEHIDDMRDDW